MVAHGTVLHCVYCVSFCSMALFGPDNLHEVLYCVAGLTMDFFFAHGRSWNCCHFLGLGAINRRLRQY